MSENKFGKLSRLSLRTGLRNGKTIIEDVAFTAPYKIMNPFPKKNGGISVMPLCASAGIMEGDRQIRIYSCGHRAEFNVEKKPEAKELQVYIPCPQCRNKINSTILTISELNDLKPPLRGTPAQIEYGDKNRQRFINEWVKRASDKQAEIIRKIIKNEDHGGFWMDNKDILKEERFVNEYTPSAKRNNKSKKKKTSEDSAQQRTASQLKQDIIQHIVKPEEIKSNILIYIELENKTTINVFPTQYNDEIENILKDMN